MDKILNRWHNRNKHQALWLNIKLKYQSKKFVQCTRWNTDIPVFKHQYKILLYSLVLSWKHELATQTYLPLYIQTVISRSDISLGNKFWHARSHRSQGSQTTDLNHCGLVTPCRATLSGVMACQLMAWSHYLDQCWLISQVLWHSSEGNFTVSAVDIHPRVWKFQIQEYRWINQEH